MDLMRFDFGRPSGQQPLEKKQPKIDSFTVTRSCSADRANHLNKLISKMIVEDLRPVSIVDGNGFRELMGFCEPGYNLPHRTFFTSQLEQMFVSLKSNVKKQMASSDAVSLTADVWTSSVNESYLSVTAHFIDEKLKLQRRVLACMPVDERHTGDNISSWLQQTVQAYDLPMHKIVALVHDNGSNIVAAAKKLENANKPQWASVRCAAHTLQLVIHAAPQCNTTITESLTAARRVVEFFKRSELATTSLHKVQKQMSMKDHQLVMEVSTRWNSTLYMIDRLIEQRWPVSVVLMEKAADSRKATASLSDTQWEVLSNLKSLLKPFEVATTFLSGEAYVTASVVPSLIMGLCSKMQAATGDETYVTDFKHTALSKLSARWPILYTC